VVRALVIILLQIVCKVSVKEFSKIGQYLTEFGRV